MEEPRPAGVDDELIPPLLEPLLGVHGAATPAWLADAAATAAERGLGALYALLFLTDTSGHLVGERPASSVRMRALVRLNDALGANVIALRFDPAGLLALAAAMRDGHAVALRDLHHVLPLTLREQELEAAQRGLGVARVWVAPLYWDGEGLGVLLLLMPANPPVPLAQAELLGRHVAVALRNLREREAGRRRGELDAVRWVYDERRFADELNQEIQRAERHKRPLSLFVLRVENLPEVRARYGRFLADRVLRQIGGALEDTMRHTDFLGAFQEDGFAAILVEADRAAAERAKMRLTAGLSSIALPNAQLSKVEIRLTYATATMPEDGTTSHDLEAAAVSRLGQETQTKDLAAR